MQFHTYLESPLGALLLTGDGEHITGLYMPPQKHAPEPGADWVRNDAVFAEAIQQLTAYFGGERQQFDLPLKAAGTDFQQRVWRGLLDIPFGETWSYAELARHIGQPGASRAVGLANGRNPISIIIPCHRVIGANGSLTGYGGGLDRKRWLLAHERSQALHGTVNLFDDLEVDMMH
jgi:methylated-DNA-[protein]-cysteine S-methyltransferase